MSKLDRFRRAILPVGAVLVLSGSALPAQGADPAAAARDGIDGGPARSVILLIGDGMGDSEITLARDYARGAAGRLALDGLPMTGSYTTYSVHKDDPSKPDYVTDSAASATGWATGHKTYNGAIGVAPDGRPRPSILELAQRAGYRTGDVTTAELTDATPAAITAHVADRSCQGPADMKQCPDQDRSRGGAGSIAEQQVERQVDVYLGGGRSRFEQTVTAGRFAGRTVLDQAKASGYTVVTDRLGLTTTPADAKVLGLFASGTMDLEWAGPSAAPYPANTAPVRCTESNPARPAGQPHLSELTRTAIDLLDAKAGDGGFFLQVEGGSIDKQDHAANPCGQIGETVEFDRSVAVALDYAKSHPDTLVVVTADHGHTSQIVEYPQTAARHSPGAIVTLLTHDDAPLVVNYATVANGSQEHTGTQVRIAARGPQAFRVLGTTDQTDLFDTLRTAMGLD